MATLFAHGIGAGLPSGFEGRIVKRQGSGIEVANAVAQFSTFALPSDVGDFGGGAVNLMGNNDIFAVLFEYGSDSVGTRLFAHQGMPRPLGTSDFQPHVLRRGLTGQSGTQWFFTELGRPFTLYVVLGSHARRSVLVPRVNRLLEGLTIEPSSLPAVAGVPWN
ncbi:MAG TPA: hypothetical protein VIH95_10290 [Acidimicrobiales bacterium]